MNGKISNSKESTMVAKRTLSQALEPDNHIIIKEMQRWQRADPRIAPHILYMKIRDLLSVVSHRTILREECNWSLSGHLVPFFRALRC